MSWRDSMIIARSMVMRPWGFEERFVRFTAYFTYVLMIVAMISLIGPPAVFWVYVCLVVTWLPCVIIANNRMSRALAASAARLKRTGSLSTLSPEDWEDVMVARARKLLEGKPDAK